MEKDFKKLYDEIVGSDWFKRAYHNKSLGERPFIIQELEESEDERIRKTLVKIIKSIGLKVFETEGVGKNDVLLYLEKRKEQTEDTVLFQKGVEEGKKLMMEVYPKWHKVQRGSCFDKFTNFLLSAREGHFYCSAMEVPRDGYILLVDELERLPKEDEK